jgi:hypothetical protein
MSQSGWYQTTHICDGGDCSIPATRKINGKWYCPFHANNVPSTPAREVSQFDWDKEHANKKMELLFVLDVNRGIGVERILIHFSLNGIAVGELRLPARPAIYLLTILGLANKWLQHVHFAIKVDPELRESLAEMYLQEAMRESRAKPKAD